jgi:LacI family transcriptional regulator
MAKKVTMQDIADKLNVSKMTISKCFQNASDVSQEMKTKVLLVAQELGYTYKKLDKYEVAVLMSEQFLSKQEVFYNTVYKRLDENANVKNIQLSLITIKKDDEEKLHMRFDASKYHAVIILGELSFNYIETVKSYNKPMVCVDFYFDELKLDSVLSNNYHAGYIATNYLINKGHKDIAYIGNIHATMSIMDRYMGFTKSMHKHGLNINSMWVISDRKEHDSNIEFSLPEQMPTAFLCNNDHVAFLVIEKLKAKGIRVPEDVSVIGFDDVLYSRLSTPKITTMKISRKQMADQATKLLLRRIKSPNAPLSNVVMDCILIERESVK